MLENPKETRGRSRKPEWDKLISDIEAEMEKCESEGKKNGHLWVQLEESSDPVSRVKYTDRLHHSTSFQEFKEKKSEYRIGINKSKTKQDYIAVVWSEVPEAKEEN